MQWHTDNVETSQGNNEAVNKQSALKNKVLLGNILSVTIEQNQCKILLHNFELMQSQGNNR